MSMKKRAAATLVGGLALLASPGQAFAETGSQRFTIIQVGGGPSRIVATGVITGVGTEVDNRTQVPPGSPFQATYTFSEGELFATVARAGRPQIEFNPSSCVTTVNIVDTSTITGGTGAFQGASGSSTDTVRVTSIGARDGEGRCLPPGSPPLFEIGIIRTDGSLTLP